MALTEEEVAGIVGNVDESAGNVAEGEGSPEEKGKKEADPAVTAKDLELVRQTVENLAQTVEYQGRVKDQWGTEMGTIRKLLEERVAREEPVRHDPEADAQAFSNDPREFISSVVKDAVRSSTPKAESGEVQSKFLRDEQRAFGIDHPDYKNYSKRMTELLRMDEHRVFTRSADGQAVMDPYRSYVSAYRHAKNEETDRLKNEADTNRGKTSDEQRQAKLGAGISGSTGGGTPRGTPSGLSPEKIRALPMKDLLLLADKLGHVSKSDPPK